MRLELKSVSYKYSPESDALNKVSLQIEQGEFIGIMGETGSGKTTLIQMMDGLLKPYEGTVLLNGQDIHAVNFDRSILRAGIGVVFQFPDYQLFETTVERDVAFGLKQAGFRRSERKNAVKKALADTGFDYEKVKNRSPLSFSGGEKRRIAIAGILAANPEIFIFDEPVSGLDCENREWFEKLVSDLNKQGKTIIIVSHNTDFLAEYTRRLIIMKNGQVLKDGKTENVLAEYPFLKQNGIGAGQVCEIAEMLRENGADISPGTVTFNQFIDEICRVYGRNEK